MIQNYLTVLEESLQKKIEILQQIEQKSLEQSKAFSEGTMSLPALDTIMDEKNELIGRMTKLDEGFESLYEKISQKK